MLKYSKDTRAHSSGQKELKSIASMLEYVVDVSECTVGVPNNRYSVLHGTINVLLYITNATIFTQYSQKD